MAADYRLSVMGRLRFEIRMSLCALVISIILPNNLPESVYIITYYSSNGCTGFMTLCSPFVLVLPFCGNDTLFAVICRIVHQR